VGADDRRAPGEVAEGDGAHDALRLGHDVVVEQQDVVADARGDGLVLGAREPAGPADVALLDDPQLAAHLLLDAREVGLGADPLGALVDHQDLVEDGHDLDVGCQLGQQRHARLGADDGQPDGGGAVTCAVGRHVRIPGRLLEHGAL
jgi:hypothetical protein